MRGSWALGAVLTGAVLAACGGGVEEVDDTVATITPIRGRAEIGETTAAVVARATSGETVRTDAEGLSRLVLDPGPHLLLDHNTAVELGGSGSVMLSEGRVFVEVDAGESLSLSSAGGSVRASGAAFDVRREADSTVYYVVRGEVSYTHVASGTRGILGAGQRLELGEEPAITPATLWRDWTGGLARPGPGGDGGPAGVGALEARVPGETGQARWPLVIRRLDVRVSIDRDLAITEVDQVFFNPASETVEGLYRIRVPEGAVLQRFAVDRADRMVDGYVRERAMARAAYDRQVYRGSTEDPALLEWDAPGRYRARIYPIGAGETRRIVIRYAEWLRPPAGGEARMYRYPMGGGARAPHIQELSLSVDVEASGAQRVRAGMGALVEEGAVRIRRSDFRPRADFWLELVGTDAQQARAWTAPHRPPPRAPDAAEVPNEADERDYFYLPLILPTTLADDATDEPLDLVILADVSAGTDRSHLELGRSVVESIAAHLDEEDRVTVVSADLTIRSVIEGEEAALGAATAGRVEALLDGLARVPAGGATDLGQAIAAAAETLDPTRRGAVVYVGDGTPTVGELRAEGLLEALGRLPDPVRLYAVAVGSEANLGLLETVTRGGGLALRVEERAEAADAAMAVLAHVERPVAHQVTVALGDGLDNAFPRRPMDAVLGDVFPVVARVRGEVPTEVTVRGMVRGTPFEEVIALESQTTNETTDLRLRWAGERLRQLLLEGAGREEVAELGTRYGLITPFTSYYVPSRSELERMGPTALNLIDQPDIRVGMQRRVQPSSIAAAVLMAPLSLAGCSYEAGSSAESEAPEWLDESVVAGDRNEGAMGEDDSRRSNNRYGIEGPGEPEPEEESEAAPDPAMVGQLGALGYAAPTTPAAAAETGEAGPMDALTGAEIGENSGFGGLGLRGTGRGGGGTGEGTIGLGNLGTIGHGAGGGSQRARADSNSAFGDSEDNDQAASTGSGYGRGAGGLQGRSAAIPRIRTGTAEVRGSLAREVIRRVIRRHINEVRFCYEQELNARPDLTGRVSVRFTIGPTGAVQDSSVSSSTLSNARVEQCIAQALRRWRFPAPPGGGVVVVTYPFVLSSAGGSGARSAPTPPSPTPPTQPTVVTTVVTRTGSRDGHARRQCSDAAYLPLSDRESLWTERLGAENNAAAWVRLYRDAIRACEARTWRDRRAFLGRILGRAGGVESMTQVHRLMQNPAERTFLRGRILRRVRTPEQLRTVRAAFGLGTGVDWELVAQILDRARTDAAKVRALRRLTMQHPDSFELKLRLLGILERTGNTAEAKRLADRMRADPLADPGVRTAIGEMYLRLNREDEARRVFSEIVEFAPLDELARRRLGDLYRAHGWYEDAYRQYLTLAEIRPDDPTVLLLQAQAAAGAGRVDEALRLERRLMQTAQPGAAVGVARSALLWSSVRYARLKQAARESGDDARLEALSRRMRRSGLLRESGALRITLVWSHPDAQLALFAAHPGLALTRPPDLSPELGLEAFHLEEQEAGTYQFEVRQMRAEDDLTEVDAQLVVVWNEGESDERVELVDLRFDPEHTSYTWDLTGTTLDSTTPGGAQ
ncbi:MAG: TonB family protein [Sandaracinaceae bacterium]